MMVAADRIAELEAELEAKDAVIESQRARIAQLESRVAQQERQIEQLSKQVMELLTRLGENSRNSHRPPSSDGPGARNSGSKRGNAPSAAGDAPTASADKGKPRNKPNRQRGGQAGHKGTKRDLVPADQVDEVINIYPKECENCGDVLAEVPDPLASRHQVTEIPPLTAHTTEFRGHTVRCGCGHHTTAKLQGVIPVSPFGPRLMAITALLTGIYHVSRRRTAAFLRDVLGVRISLGAVSAIEGRVGESLGPAFDEAWSAADAAAVKHTDATSWLQSGQLRSLWMMATSAVTVFKVMVDGARETIQPWFGSCRGILISDRATVFTFWKMSLRQVCWAHLLRKFVAFSQRAGPGRAMGSELLQLTAMLFHYWQSRRDGVISRETFLAWMAPVREQIEACLQRAVVAGIDGVSGSCADILAHREALWTFLTHAGVDPTNNHGERELRGFVMWRKRCFGSQSDRGNVFAERIMTVSHTARKQNRDVLAFLIESCTAWLAKTAAPSLLAPRAKAA
jgi:transposase